MLWPGISNFGFYIRKSRELALLLTICHLKRTLFVTFHFDLGRRMNLYCIVFFSFQINFIGSVI